LIFEGQVSIIIKGVGTAFKAPVLEVTVSSVYLL
jgi:hypothetical protein